jgi:hypothetical protein
MRIGLGLSFDGFEIPRLNLLVSPARYVASLLEFIIFEGVA